MLSKKFQVLSRPVAGAILASLVSLFPTGDRPGRGPSGRERSARRRCSGAVNRPGRDFVDSACLRDDPTPTAFPRADAGDDLIGLVGRRVTLNGRSSTPAGRIGFRWFQVEGPPVNIRAEVGDVLTFLPEEPGTYRFALVVAEAGSISEPDFATVLIVAEAPGIGRAPAVPARAPPRKRPPGGPSIRSRMGPRLPELSPRRSRKSPVASISTRHMPTCSRGPLHAWNPSCPPTPRGGPHGTNASSSRSRPACSTTCAVGLDLSRPDAMAAPLSAAHRKRVAGLFRAMAKGFRSASPPVEREEIPEPAKLDLIPMKQSDQVKESDLGANGRVSP